MPAALPLSTYITQAAQGSTEYKNVEVEYGNGYSQRAADGINYARSTWNVEWGILTLTEFQTIVTLFDAAGGVDYFTWTTPGDAVLKKWIIKKYSRSVLSGDQYSITAELKQVFDL